MPKNKKILSIHRQKAYNPFMGWPVVFFYSVFRLSVVSVLFTPVYTRSFIFETVFWAGRQHCPMFDKISHKWVPFAFGSTYLHQTSTECVSNQYTQFDTSTCQMWLHVIECLLILLRFFGYFYTSLLTIHVWSVVSPPKFHRLCV